MKKIFAAVLSVAMIFSLLPAAAFATDDGADGYAAAVRVEKDSTFQLNGQDSYVVSFCIKTPPGGEVKGYQSLSLVYDTSVFELMNKSGSSVQSTLSKGEWIYNKGAYSVRPLGYDSDEEIGWTAGMTSFMLSSDESKTFVLLQPELEGTTLDTNGEEVAVIQIRLGLTESATEDQVTKNSVRLLSKDEFDETCQSSICIVNTGSTAYKYGTIVGGESDALAEPTFTYIGFDPQLEMPTCTAPTGLTAVYGDTLDRVELENPAGNTPGTWSWVDDSQDVGNVGENEFTAQFKPDDTKTYQTVTTKIPVTVQAKELEEVTVAQIDDQDYTGSEVEPSVTVTGGGVTLTSSDYDATYSNNTDVGEASVCIKEKVNGNYTFDEAEATFQITAATLLEEDFTTIDTTNQGYTGEPIKPSVTSETLIENTDYTVSYENNTNVGTATIKITGEGNYTGTIEKTFSITEKAIQDTDFSFDLADKTYTGQEIEPPVTSSSLAASDYKVVYTDNTDAGTATITVTGEGNYTGTVTRTFQILAKEITAKDLTIDTTARDYTGEPIEPTVTPKSTVTTSDYDVAYTNNTNAGEATITVTGKGNYTGTINETFTINKIKYDKETTASQSVLSSEYDHNNNTHYTVDLSGLIAPGGELGDPTGMDAMVTGATISRTALDLTVAPQAEGTKTEIKVPVTGSPNYEGYSITVTVTAVGKEKATVSVSAPEVTYDGTSHEATVTWPDEENATNVTKTVTYTKGSATTTVTYSANGSATGTAPKDAGTYTVKAVYESDEQYGTATTTLIIAPKEAALTWSGYDDLTYDGTAKSVTASVGDLVSGDDCTVTVTGGKETNAGTYTATATALDNDNYVLPENVTQKYTIAPKKTALTVTLDQTSFPYTDQAQQPAVTVKDGSKTLTADTDYTVTLPDGMTNVGKYTIQITGANNYAGSTGSATYEITKVSQAALTIPEIGTKTYGDVSFEVTVGGGTGTGKATLTSSDPSVLKVEEKADTADTYTVTILKTGTATLTANKAGDDNYQAAEEVTRSVTVSAKSIADATVTLPEKFSAAYTGTAFQPAVTVKLGDNTLSKDTDYTVAYKDNVNAGTATVTVTGQGNYTGTATVTFAIAQQSIADKTPTVTGTNQVGSALTANLRGVTGSELTWQWYRDGAPVTGADQVQYTLTSADSGSDITVRATAAAQGNYTGTTTASAAATIATQAISGSVTITSTNTDEDGLAQIDAVLTASAASIAPDLAQEDGTWQWYRNGAAIQDATASTYTVTEADAGATLKAVFTPGSKFTGTAEGTMNAGKAALTGTVTVTGDTAVGSELTASVTGGPDAANYTIVWLRDGTPISGSDATGTTYTVTSADQGKSISAKIVAAGNAYTGDVTSQSVPIPAGKPEAPAVTATAGNGQVTLTWKAPANNGAPITGYQVTVGEGDPISLEAGITTYVASGLTNGTEYSFSVVAVNSAGTSDAGTATASPKAVSSPSGSTGSPSGGSSGSPSGGSSATTPASTPATNSDGSVTTTTDKTTGAVTTTTKNADGSTSVVTTAKDGTVTETNTTAAGVTGTTVTGPNGQVTSAEATVPAGAGKDGQAVTIPVEVKASDDTSTAPVVTIKTSEPTQVEIPVENVTPGVVAVIVNEDGTETVDKTSRLTEDGVVLTVDGTANVKLVDNAKTFSDVKSTSWYNDAVTFVSARGIMNGTGKSLFSPGVNLNRGMVAVILYHLENDPSQRFQAIFTDVADGKWYSAGIQWAASNGVINGYGNGLYGPTDTLTREQLATILYRYAGLKGYDTQTSGDLSTFRDGSTTSSWAQSAMEWAVGTGLLSGKGNATLAPKESASRAQVAQIFMNFCTNIAK